MKEHGTRDHRHGGPRKEYHHKLPEDHKIQPDPRRNKNRTKGLSHPSPIGKRHPGTPPYVPPTTPAAPAPEQPEVNEERAALLNATRAQRRANKEAGKK